MQKHNPTKQHIKHLKKMAGKLGGTSSVRVDTIVVKTIEHDERGDPDIVRLNKEYALILIGDKAAILREKRGDPNKRDQFQILSIAAFHEWLRPFSKEVFTRTGSYMMPLAKFWLQHSDRRQYEGIIFAPGRDVSGYYNLWRGFAVQPKPGDCSKFKAHLKDNICRGDESLYLWVFGWYADIFQHPDEKCGTSLVMRGKQGVGKTKVAEVIGSLFHKNHFALVEEPRYVTGRFNSHLVSCLLLHADEAFWAGDHTAEGKLKGMITGKDHFIEYKGKEPLRVANYIRLSSSGNHDWQVPAGWDERRFATLDVGEDHKQDHPYFAAIDHEMDNGGREALLYELLRFDLSKVNLRAIPMTSALLDQKISSLSPEAAWWLDVLMRGELPWGCSEPDRCPTQRLFDSYIRHASKIGVRRRAIETVVGMFLTRLMPELKKREGSYRIVIGIHGDTNEVVGSVYDFPPLDKCRQLFDAKLQQNIEWDETKAWRHAPQPTQPTRDYTNLPF
jgi:hypothetical protein